MALGCWISFLQLAGSVRAQGLIVSRLDKPSRGTLLCYVTDRHSLAAFESPESQETLLSKIGAAAAAGVDWIQIREKDLSGKDCGLLTRKALQRAAKPPASSAAPTRILVNDRLDVALSEHAGGVHLSENSLPLPEAKFGAPQGLERLAEVCRAVSVPVLAIGGVTLANSAACLAAGASGIAAIRLFQDAPDMSSLVRSLRKLTR